jgi:hypothetical protein
LRAGFPHSDICGSKLVCQLPAAFRRLPRPSSPVIAKASTACTYSLDPITVSTLHWLCFMPSGYRLSRACSVVTCLASPFVSKPATSIQSSNPAIESLRHARRPARKIALSARSLHGRIRSFYFFQFVKEQPSYNSQNSEAIALDASKSVWLCLLLAKSSWWS